MKERINVLMIADTPRNLANIKGGLEAATVNLIMGFRGLPVNLHVISIRTDIRKSEDCEIYAGCMVHYRPFTIAKSKLAEFLYFGHQKIKRLVREIHPDIIHNQGTGPMLLMLRGFDKSRIVITQHGIMAEELKYKISSLRKLKFFIKASYDKYLLPRFNGFISISDYNRQILARYQKRNPKFYTHIIYNSVNDDFFHTGQLQRFDKIVFVGLVNKLKGVHILLEALLMLKQRGIIYSLDIAGGTKEPEYLELIRKTITDNGLADQVTLHGWVDQKKVKQLLEEATIFLLPSLQECLPISIAEAMAAERVIVATDTGGIPEMLVNKESGFLFTKGNAAELTDILMELHNNSEIIVRVANNAKLEAMKKFQSRSVAEQTLEFYRAIIENNYPKAKF